MDSQTNNTVNIREISSLDELEQCTALEQNVWGVADREVIPASHLSAVIHAGGLVIGAFDQDALVGYSYGFMAFRREYEEPVGLHSHLMAVLPPYRGSGLGSKLKWFQRSWALARGHSWITWTFDPLQAHNARLNLEHLGAVTGEYLINAYGQFGGSLNASLPSDRFLVRWFLQSPRVIKLAAGESEMLETANLPNALDANVNSAPGTPCLTLSEARFWVTVPTIINQLMSDDPELAYRWRLATRSVFGHYFDKGYVVTRFINGRYLMERQMRVQ